MILVDIGNSGLKAARWDGATTLGDSYSPSLTSVIKWSWSPIGKLIRKSEPGVQDSATERWTQQGDTAGVEWVLDQLEASGCLESSRGENDQEWRLASVNREVQAIFEAGFRKRNPRAPLRLVTHRDIPMTVHVDHPDMLGIDRLLAARAAWHLATQDNPNAGPLIVVQAGTAVTLDWVDASGAYCGGAILPGIGLALQYLAAGTDRLPWLPSNRIATMPPLPGVNTEQAIAAGVHASVVGGARYLIERYRGKDHIPVFVSGGDGRLIHPLLDPPVTFIEHMVLIGLGLPLTKNA